MAIWQGGQTPTPQALNSYYARLRLYANFTVSDFVSGVAEFRVEQYLNTTVATPPVSPTVVIPALPGPFPIATQTLSITQGTGDQFLNRTIRWDRVSMTMNMLGIFAVKDAPLTLTLSAGQIDSYASNKLYRLDAQDILKRLGNMEIVYIDRRWGVWVESTIAKMITIKFGQRMTEGEGLATPSYGTRGLPYTWLQVDFNKAPISLTTSMMIDGKAVAAKPNQLEMPWNFSALLTLQDLVPALLNLKVGAGISATDILNTGLQSANYLSPYNVWYIVAAAQVELNFSGMSSKTTGAVAFKLNAWDTTNTFIINIIDLTEEFWFTQFLGIEIGTVMTCNPYAPASLENLEMLSLWKLGGVQARIGWVYVPDNMQLKTGTDNASWWYCANIYDYASEQSPFAKTQATGGFVWYFKCSF
jgi:hypothetical protein